MANARICLILSGMRSTYGVVWRETGGGIARGRLEFLPLSVRLDGMVGHLPSVREIRYADLAGVRVGRGVDDRIDGRPSLVIEPRLGEAVSVASLAEPGVIGELAERLGALQLGHVGRRTAVVLPILPESRDAVRMLLEAGPPFDPDAVGLVRHEVFLTADEVIFVFESPLGSGALEALLAQPELWQRAAEWHRHVVGPPRIAEEAYSWSREEDLDRALVPPGLRA